MYVKSVTRMVVTIALVSNLYNLDIVSDIYLICLGRYNNVCEGIKKLFWIRIQTEQSWSIFVRCYGQVKDTLETFKGHSRDKLWTSKGYIKVPFKDMLRTYLDILGIY